MSTSRQSDRDRQHGTLPYLPALDGLRALAIMAVLLYHATPALLPGGFLGVDVFFGISAYLITALLTSESQATGRIDLSAFWLRRARRLLPAAFGLITASLLVTAVYLPEEIASLRAMGLAAFGYATNWYLIFSQQSYFETIGRPSLLQHLWSLAVEEQFYLLWPLLLMLILRLRDTRARLGVIVVAATLSLVWMMALYQPDHDPSRVYYGTDTRAFSLLIGAALAVVWMPWRDSHRASKMVLRCGNIFAPASFAMLAYLCLRVTPFDAWLFPWGLLLVAVCTTCITAAVVHPQSAPALKWLASRPLRYVGLQSYSIYLWHWPIFMLTRPNLDVPLDGLPLFALRMALTIAFAELSYRYVETPCRRGALGRAWNWWRQQRSLRRATWSAASLILLLAVGTLGAATMTAKPTAPSAYLMEQATVAALSRYPLPLAVPNPAAVAPAVPEPPIDGGVLAGCARIEPPQDEDTALIPRSSDGSDVLSLDSASAGEANMMEQTDVAPLPDAVAPDPPEAQVTTAPEPVAIATPLPPSILPQGTRVTAIGDSVMVSAASELRRVIYGIEIDAQLGRQTWTTLDIVRARAGAKQIGDLVVLQTGDNGYLSASQFHAMMGYLSTARRVVMVNIKVPREWEKNNNDILRGESTRYPNLVVVDWYEASAGHPEYFWNDGMHLRPEGAQMYVSLIADAITAS